MKWFLHSTSVVALMLSALLVCGCHPLAGNPLCGQWEIANAESLARKLNLEDANHRNQKDLQNSNGLGAGDDVGVSVDDAEEPSTKKMILLFEASGELRTLTRIGRLDPPPKVGTWKLISHAPSQQRMKIECTLGTQTTEHEVWFIEPDLIELVPPNMAGTNNKIRFTRQK